jgi:hypothetical protein
MMKPKKEGSLLRDVLYNFRSCYCSEICCYGTKVWYTWGGGVQLGPLGTMATNWPIVPALGDYEGGEFGGMMIVRGNRTTRRKPAPVPFCLP